MDYIQNSIVKNRKQSLLGILLLTVIVLVLGFSFFTSATPDSLAVAPAPLQAVELPEEREWIPELPVRLVIPAIDVDAEVQYVGVDEDGTGEMEVPSNFTDVGWYKHGVRPGMRGSAVIAGHYNGKGIPEAVFYDLHTLEIGDEVVIMSAERIEEIFQVVKIETYAYDAPTTEIFMSTDEKKRLNLITCSGEWLSDENQYNKRTVVFTELLTDVE
jgi:LPXTG-site transpeptidase (sortase) family protein